MMIFLVGFEVFGQIFDPFSQDSHLNVGRSGIVAVALEFIDQRLLLFARNAHAFPPVIFMLFYQISERV